MSSSKNIEIAKTSFLSKSNSSFIETMYLRFLEHDPTLPVSWRNYFETLDEETDIVVKEIEGPTWKPNKKKISIKDSSELKDDSNINLKNNDVDIEKEKSNTVKAIALIRAYRIRGHLIANLDPLNLQVKDEHPELKPETYGFGEKDFDRKIFLDGVLGLQYADLRQILEILKNLVIQI